MDSFDLPELALIRMLNYLPARDQLNARLVCRYWKLLIDSSVQPDELILFHETYPRPVYWFHNGKEVDLANAFLLTDRTSLKNEFFLSYFRQVRRLMIVHIVGTSPKEFIEQIQTSFPELQHLQFNSLGRKCWFGNSRLPNYNTNFQLANLRTFYSQTGDIPLGLHLPQLRELFVYSHLKIDETTDEQTRLCIQNLRLLLVQKLTYPPNFKFSKLKVFYFNEPTPAISLSDFPRLKELHYFDESSWPHDGIDTHFWRLFAQKKRFKRKRLRFYFDGLELDDKDPDFDTLVAYMNPDEPFCSLDLNENVVRFVNDAPLELKFNLLSKDLLMSDALDDELVDLQEGDELAESMFRCAQSIRFRRFLSKESLNLFELSNRFRYVCAVSIHIELSQAQLDRLSDALPYLVDFFYGPTFFKSHILNFEFIAKFKSLDCFNVHRNLLSIDELRLILKNCKFIDFLDFEKSNASIRIVNMKRTRKHNFYKAKWLSSDGVQFATATFGIEELFDYLETCRWLGKNDFLGKRKDEEPPLYLGDGPDEEEEEEEEDEEEWVDISF